jgi:transcriptional regulator with XRE-family HTH domain
VSSIADRIKEVRIFYGKSQKEMSRYMNLGMITWQNYERGETSPKCETLNALSRDGFNINWILTGNGTMREERFRQPAAVAEEPQGYRESFSRAISIEEREKLFKFVLASLREAEGAEDSSSTAINAFRITEHALFLAQTPAAAFRMAEVLLKE